MRIKEGSLEDKWEEGEIFSKMDRRLELGVLLGKQNSNAFCSDLAYDSYHPYIPGSWAGVTLAVTLQLRQQNANK